MNQMPNPRAKISFSSAIHPELILRHLNSPVSPPPDYSHITHPSGFRETAVLSQTSISPDFTSNGYRQSRTQLQTRSEISPRTGRTSKLWNQRSDFHILPPLRKKSPQRQRHQIRELPQIYVCPAPKYIRQQQRAPPPNLGYDARKLYQRQQQQIQPKEETRCTTEPETTQEPATVTIPLHLTSTSPVEGVTDELNQSGIKADPTPTFEGKDQSTKITEIASLPMKSVNLNKGLEAAQFGKETNLTIALSRRHVPKRLKNCPTKEIQVMSLSHLPLSEVYLKPETGSSREMAAKQQRDKMLRIINWLKELNYLDEQTIEKGRIEIEKTHFQLPDIKDAALIA